MPNYNGVEYTLLLEPLDTARKLWAKQRKGYRRFELTEEEVFLARALYNAFVKERNDANKRYREGGGDEMRQVTADRVTMTIFGPSFQSPVTKVSVGPYTAFKIKDDPIGRVYALRPKGGGRYVDLIPENESMQGFVEIKAD